MKFRLILMRHAKSSWDDPVLEDHDRPLNERGQREAPKVARRLVKLGWSPQVVLSSDSERTRQTWQRMGEFFQPVPPVQFMPELYHAGISAVIGVLAPLPADIRCVLLLGHNPGWEEAAQWLTGVPQVLKTSNALLLEARGKCWTDPLHESGDWKLCEAVRPKEL